MLDSRSSELASAEPIIEAASDRKWIITIVALLLGAEMLNLALGLVWLG